MNSSFAKNPVVKVVYDSDLCGLGSKLVIPEEVGVPRDDQFQGSELDKLVELAGRVCYDSVGKGRSSAEYHAHLAAVDHGSVWEHAALDLITHCPSPAVASQAMFNLGKRPGVFLEGFYPYEDGKSDISFTVNLRAIRDWKKFSDPGGYPDGGLCDNERNLGLAIQNVAIASAPLVFQDKMKMDSGPVYAMLSHFWSGPSKVDHRISIYAEGVSRGLSHDWVRHHYRCAVSQRSTRFCDEYQSRDVLHPYDLVGIEHLERLSRSREEYKDAFAKTVSRLRELGKDEKYCLKQSRAVARQVLPHSMETKFVFTASRSQWNRIFAMRFSDQADAELYRFAQAARTSMGLSDGQSL